MQVYYQLILKICSVSYVEILLASSIQLYLTFKTFKSILASCEFLSTFKECFVPFYHGGVSHSNLRLVTGKPAGFLLGLFQRKQVTLKRLRRFVFVANTESINSLDDHIKCFGCACM